MARNILREELRRRARDAAARVHLADRLRAATKRLDPVEVADLWRRAPEWFVASLPAPYRELASWQYVEGRPRRDLVVQLRRWRGVSEAEARRLIAKTHAMLRCLGAGGNPRTRWPSAFDPKVNPWIGSDRRAAKGRAAKGRAAKGRAAKGRAAKGRAAKGRAARG